MKKATMLMVVLAACATQGQGPSTGADPAIPGQAYDVGGKTMFGASYGEVCDTMAQMLCNGRNSAACVQGIASICTPYSAKMTYAPSEATWDALWQECFREIRAGEFDKGCDQLLPP